MWAGKLGNLNNYLSFSGLLLKQAGHLSLICQLLHFASKYFFHVHCLFWVVICVYDGSSTVSE